MIIVHSRKKNGDILTYLDRAKKHAYVPTGKIAQLELEINELKDSFLLRLAGLEDNEKGHSLEKIIRNENQNF